MSSQNISKNNKVEKGNMVFGDNNTVENNINETHIHHHYDTDNRHNAPEKYGISRMREGLERHIGTILKDCEAIFIPYLQTSYIVPDEPEFKGKGQKVKAYTLLNICDSEGNLLADHAQIDLKGISIYGSNKFNIPKDLNNCSNRIRFTAYIKDYTSRGKVKTGVYLMSKPELINDTIHENPFKKSMFKIYNELEIDDIKFYFENIVDKDELRFLIDQYIMEIYQISRYISQETFIMNYILSLLFLRTKQPYLVRQEISMLIDSLSIYQMKILLKCLSFTLSYSYSVDVMKLGNIIYYVTLFIMQQFGVKSRSEQLDEMTEFKDWCTECYMSSNAYTMAKAFHSCIFEMFKNYKFTDDDLSIDLNAMFNLYDNYNSSLSQLRLLRKEKNDNYNKKIM